MRHSMRTAAGAAAIVAALLGGATGTRAADTEALAAKVRAREEGFAKTMADRDHAAFAAFVADEAVFLSPTTALRGRAAVAEGWKRFFDGPRPPFSWRPERVHVIDSGTLALSTGPVFDPAGARAGTFTSTWRLDKDGEWRVVLDSGCPPCAPCGPAKEKP